jgi:hypothetical protein
MRDGRLTGSERASFERHVALCSVCSGEVRALETLAQTLRDANQLDPLDELHARRERTRLLAAFDEALVSPKRRRFSPSFALAAAASVVVVVTVLWRVRAAPPLAAVRADGDTIWSSRMEDQRQRIVLTRGALSIHVDHSRGDGRLIVVLPDGELEDIGTRFTVGADADRTMRVAVTEGRVLLRLRGRPPITIGPGETWRPEVPAPVAGATGAPLALPAWEEAEQPEKPAPRELSSQSGTPMPSPSASVPASSASVPARDSSSEFRAALDALERGANRQAANMFADCLAKHPRDPRAEDAAYLRAIALQRTGDAIGTKDAAREYLRRYPSGFRRVEMDQLSR